MSGVIFLEMTMKASRSIRRNSGLTHPILLAHSASALDLLREAIAMCIRHIDVRLVKMDVRVQRKLTYLILEFQTQLKPFSL